MDTTQRQQKTTPSEPYVITVTHTPSWQIRLAKRWKWIQKIYPKKLRAYFDNKSIRKVTILDAYNAYGSSSLNFNNPKDVSVKCENYSYVELLGQLGSCPSKISRVYLYSNSMAQVSQMLRITTKDYTGSYTMHPKYPIINPFQQQSNIVELSHMFVADGHTRIDFDLLYNSTVTFHLYPSAVFNPSASLNTEETPVSKFSNPNIAGVPYLSPSPIGSINDYIGKATANSDTRITSNSIPNCEIPPFGMNKKITRKSPSKKSTKRPKRK